MYKYELKPFFSCREIGEDLYLYNEESSVIETRYCIGGYEIFRKETNNTLNFERTTLNISDDEKVFVRIEQETGECEVIRYQYDNHLGSACLELDEQGQIISYEEYAPFGTTTYKSGRSEMEVSQKRYRYNGKERDEETGLYAYGMRYYAAWLCRFISVDPLQFKYPEYTPFQYAGNKPVTFIDLDGAEEKNPEESKPKIEKGIMYQVNEKGYITPMKDTEGKVKRTDGEFDMLYAEGKKNAKPIKIADKEILRNLAKTETIFVKEGQWDAIEGTQSVTAKYELSQYTTKKDSLSNSKSEMSKLFFFLADNSPKAEWRLHANKEGRFSISTLHSGGKSPNDIMLKIDTSSVLGMIHSHPGQYKDGEAEETSMGDDARTAQRYPSYQVYFPNSRNIYTLVRENDKTTKVTVKKRQ